MQGLLNWQAIRELKFAPMTRDGAGGSAVDSDKVAVMYNGMAELEKRSAQILADALPITSEDSVLDVGCGPGRLSIPMARRAKSLTALDAFGEMLKFCKQNAKNAGVKNIKFMQKSWLDSDALDIIGKHDVVVASRSVGLGDIKRLNDAAKKYVCITSFLEDHPSLRKIWMDLLAGIDERASKRPPFINENPRMFGYNATFNMLYDLGANVNVRIFDTVYEKSFMSKDEAYEFLKFVGEIPKEKEKNFRKNVDKWLVKDGSGVKFYRTTKSYAMWYDVSEVKFE